MTRALALDRRVLVRLPAWLGDCVMAEPLVRALLSTKSAVTLVGSARIAEGLGWSNARNVLFVALERGESPHAFDWRGHDVALLLDGSWRGAWAAVRAGIPERIGFATGSRSSLLTLALTPALERGGVPLGIGRAGGGLRRLPRPFTSACIELAALAGLEVRDRAPRIDPSLAVIERVAARFARSGVSELERCVLVHAGGRANSSKAVPPATWIAILRQVRERSRVPIVLACARGEELPARAVAAGVPGSVLLDDPPLGIAETAAAHRFAAVALAADGGSAHLAKAASSVPLIVIHGPTDPRHVADHRPGVFTARVEVECGPCHDEHCRIATDARDQCMRRLDTLSLAARTVELLSRPT